MRNIRLVAFSIFFVFIIGLPSCGKKGPPFLPKKAHPPRVEQLKGEWINGLVVLKGQVIAPANRKWNPSDITGCMVYHARYALGRTPCEGCPIKFGEPKYLKGDVIKKGLFYCEISGVKKDLIHFFKISLVGRKGAVGPPSNIVKLTSSD